MMPSSLLTTLELRLTYQVQAPSHMYFNIQAMRQGRQFVMREQTDARQDANAPPLLLREYQDRSGNRLLRFDAHAGELHLRYQATVQQTIYEVPTDLAEVPISWLPDEVLPYLLPSRFCESDVMRQAAQKLFGHVPPGRQRVEYIVQWIHDNVVYTPGSSTAETSALQAFEQRSGVCRDFAHLGITLCRALNIPARLVVGYVRFEDPPQDFHAIFEAWLGNQWVLFDATRMAPPERLVRVGNGSDAKDVAFATIFGAVQFVNMEVDISESEIGTAPAAA